MGYLQAISGSFLLIASYLNTYLTDPTIKAYLSSLDLPKSVSIGLVVLGLITYIAHGHGDE